MAGKFTIFTMIYNEYELLRQFIESIFHNVDPTSYEQILILDDYSNPKGKLREYENWLEATYPGRIRVVKFEEYRRIRHYSDTLWNEQAIVPRVFDWREFSSGEPNLGVGAGFDMMIKEVQTDYIFYCDADCLILKQFKDTLHTFAKMFDQNPLVMAIGQCRGKEDGQVHKYAGRFPYFEPRTGKMEPSGGELGPAVGALRRTAFTEHGLQISASDGRRLGTTFGAFCRSMSEEHPEFETIAYPLLTNSYLVHLGSGIIRRLTNRQELGFIFCKDILPARGGMTSARNGDTVVNHYYGRAFINMTNDAYFAYLRNKYAAPFDQLQPPLDESLVYTVG